MHVSHVGLKWMQLDWATIFNIWRNMWDQRILTLDWHVFFVANQDCILIIQIINFPTIFCNPKLRWHLRVKCICQLTFIFVFENVPWHFGFEVDRQMKFVKHTHTLAPKGIAFAGSTLEWNRHVSRFQWPRRGLICAEQDLARYIWPWRLRLLRPGPLAADREKRERRPHKNALRNHRSRGRGDCISIQISRQHQTSPKNGQLRVIQEVVDRNEPDRRPGRAGHQWHYFTATCRQGAHAVR